MQQKLALAVQEALDGSHRVTISFNESASNRTLVRGIFYLLGMLEVEWILFSKEDQRRLRVFLRCRKWERAGGNHPILLTLTSKFNKSWFVDKMQHALEQIEVVTDSKIEVIVSDVLSTSHDRQIETANN